MMEDLDPASQKLLNQQKPLMPPAKPPVSALISALRKTPTEEESFQTWIRGLPWFSEFVSEYGEEPDLSPKANYDYRAAYKAGIKPERDPYDGNRYHWLSSTPDGRMLKSPDHPTAWKEHYMRESGVNPDSIGLGKTQAEAWLRRKKENNLRSRK